MANEKVYTDYLMHGRTKGSRNGISTTKGYTAVGQKAKGRWINGRYVYTYNTPKSYGGNVENTQSGRVTKPLSPYVSDEYLREIEYNSRKNDGSVENHPDAISVNAQHRAYLQGEAEKQGHNAAYEYAKKYAKNQAKEIAPSDKARAISKKGAANNWQQQANAAASGKPSGYNNAHYNAVNQAAAERKANEVALGRQKKASERNAKAKSIANGAQNNWQQTANKTTGILGNMSREDRSLMKSKEWVSHDKNGKKQVNNGFNVNNKYGYSNYTKNDKGWHDVHMGEYNTAGVKGVKKQQDWNTSFERNHRSDIGNAISDAKEDAKKAFKEAKADAKQTYVNLKSKLKSKFKKKKK